MEQMNYFFLSCFPMFRSVTAEKPLFSNVRSLCSSCFSELCQLEPSVLESWLGRIMLGVAEDKENSGKMADNRLLLQTIATHMAKESR